MKLLIVLLFSFIALTACAPKRDDHFIHNKWKSENPQKITLEFKDDKLIETKLFGSNQIYTSIFFYEILDDKTVRMIDSTEPEYKLQITGEIKDNNELSLSCKQTAFPNGRIMIDSPPMCNRTYQRLKE